jgi:hypothetical protein
LFISVVSYSISKIIVCYNDKLITSALTLALKPPSALSLLNAVNNVLSYEYSGMDVYVPPGLIIVAGS